MLQEQYAHMRTLTKEGVQWHIHPGPYRAARQAEMINVILGTTSQHVTNVAVALSCMYAKHLAYILTTVTYISHAPAARYQFLAALRSQNRMSIVLAEPVKSGNVQHIWLCVWSNVFDRAHACRK